jgi:AraC-like DNA-binding protein
MAAFTRDFSEPEELAAAIYPSKVEMLPLCAGRFSGRVTLVDLPRVWMRRLYDNLPRIANVAHPPGRAFISFMPHRSSPPVTINGIEVGPDAMMRHGHESSSHQRSSAPTHWANMSIALPDLEALGTGFAGCNVMPARTSFIVKPQAASLARLKKLHAVVIGAVEGNTGILERPETANALEQSLIETAVDCLAGSGGQVETPAQYRHAVVMRRFRELIEANAERPLYLPEVCSHLAVSHRALSYCCQEHLGMAPKRYFLLRRMWLARRALREACPGTSVTEIAMRYGFWEFGRFAVRYRKMFGETPSATLRNRPGAARVAERRGGSQAHHSRSSHLMPQHAA